MVPRGVASRRSVAAFFGSGPRFRGRQRRPFLASSSHRGHSAPGRVRSRPGLRLTRPEAQAPHKPAADFSAANSRKKRPDLRPHFRPAPPIQRHRLTPLSERGCSAYSLIIGHSQDLKWLHRNLFTTISDGYGQRHASRFERRSDQCWMGWQRDLEPSRGMPKCKPPRDARRRAVRLSPWNLFPAPSALLAEAHLLGKL